MRKENPSSYTVPSVPSNMHSLRLGGREETFTGVQLHSQRADDEMVLELRQRGA